ncbi:MAG: adenine deaminase [Deltaproteobacteria bacterium]|nr:adenine deaminase [Deltaproteobacteria bacterium]
MTAETLGNRIRAARGEIAPDLVLKGGRVVNVFTGEIVQADVAVHEGLIVGVGDYGGREQIDATGKYLCPGLIDGHIHVESSLLAPAELARVVLPRGTTAVVADPHEIANVLGAKGIRYLLDGSEGLPVDFFIMLPSCVPATHLETSGATLSAADLALFRNEERVLGLAEMMNYPGLIGGEAAVLEKIAAFCDRVKDGHAPLLSGRDLNAYIAAGIGSDHECTTAGEALEKMRLGMHIMIREGTQAKNLRDLLPIVTPGNIHQCSLVTDDLHPGDLLGKGHLDHLIDLAVDTGLDPVQAIQMASLNTARYFGLKDRGAIAPGFRADLLVLSSLHPFQVETVYKGGRKVCDKGIPGRNLSALSTGAEGLGPMNVKDLDEGAFIIEQKGKHIRVIDLIPGQILTKGAILPAPVREGAVVADTGRDLIKIAVVERHRGTGNIGRGMVRGFGLRAGALASSVAHDSHNIVCLGCTDGDMLAAVREVASLGGGMAVVKSGGVLAELPLPIAGLMSDRPLGEVARGWESLRQAASALGCTLPEPFMALSFLALPVIPELKITDCGLVDVNRFAHVPLFLP